MLFHKKMTHPTSKEWVVFLHGLGGSSSIWFKQIRAYRKHFNLLFVDLPGHGGSREAMNLKCYSEFTDFARDVIHVLDINGIKHAHFVGISLGTIVVQAISREAPHRVNSMVLGGAVEHIFSPILVAARLLEWVRYVIPYMWLFFVCAWILLPKSHHRESRRVFIHEAKKMGQKEFYQWYRILSRKTNVFFLHQEVGETNPILYLMGSEDYMFLSHVQHRVIHDPTRNLYVMERCGHVCNIENDDEFNERSIQFIHKYSSMWNIEKVGG